MLFKKGFLRPGTDIIDFYFEEYVPTKECDVCAGRGLSLEGMILKEQYYDDICGKIKLKDVKLEKNEKEFLNIIAVKLMKGKSLSETEEKRTEEINSKIRGQIKKGYDALNFTGNYRVIERNIKKTKRANKAVSDTVGTLLLLGLAVALFSVIYISVFSFNNLLGLFIFLNKKILILCL